MSARLPADAVTEIGDTSQPPRRTLRQRLRAWWALRGLRNRQEALTVLHWQAQHELSELLQRKQGAGWAKTPTLDTRIRQARAECERVGEELDSVDLQIADLECAQ